MTPFERALKRERDRERKRRMSRQGALEAGMLSLDRQIEDVDEAESPAWLSDNGEGARKIRTFDKGLSQSGADVAYAEKAARQYWQRYKAAYMRLKRNKSYLCRTFSLICKYGKNRDASIAELQAETKDWDAANDLYFSRREKILNFFRAQGNQGSNADFRQTESGFSIGKSSKRSLVK